MFQWTGKGKNTFKWTMLFTGLIASGGIGYGIYHISNGYPYSAQTDGKVINVIGSRKNMTLEVEYEVNSKKYKKSFDVSKSVSTGSSIPVYYIPENPQSSVLSSKNAMQMWAIIAIIVGIVFLIITIALYRAESTEKFWEFAFWTRILS